MSAKPAAPMISIEFNRSRAPESKDSMKLEDTTTQSRLTIQPEPIKEEVDDDDDLDVTYEHEDVYLTMIFRICQILNLTMIQSTLTSFGVCMIRYSPP